MGLGVAWFSRQNLIQRLESFVGTAMSKVAADRKQQL
jgi:hypothetical protein